MPFVARDVMAALQGTQSHAVHRLISGGDRRRSCAAESRSMTRMVAPHLGQRQQFERGSRSEVGEV